MVDGLDGQWRPTLWLVFATSCTVLLAIIFFADETWYDRSLAVQPEVKRDVAARFNKLVGITAYQQRKYKMSVGAACLRLGEVGCAFAAIGEPLLTLSRVCQVCLKPVIWLTFVIYALSFMWAVGINITSSILFATPREAGGYGFNLTSISGLYATPLIGLFIGELIGHWVRIASEDCARRAKLTSAFSPRRPTTPSPTGTPAATRASSFLNAASSPSSAPPSS